MDGTTLAQGRSLYDFTISAPKSVSILAIIGGDDRLIEAHRKAVSEALQEAETYAASRVRQAGANEDRPTGNLALAVYHHDTSRELDPQLHTHAVAANLTYDGTEGRWKALQASEIYERRAYLSEVYRNALAREVRALGYEIESQRDAKGRDTGFEIRGVPKELLAKFSQRSLQRDQAIEDFVAKHGRRPTDNEVAVLVRESRADKLIEISTRELRAKQLARLGPGEEEVLTQIRAERLALAPSMDSSALSLEHAKDHIFERVSVALDHKLLTEALRHGRGRIRLSHLKGELGVQESAGRILRSGREVATETSLERERSMIAAINRGVGGFEPLGAGRPFVASDSLRPEQKNAVEFVLRSRDRAVSISGAAGTGKTATLRELLRGLKEAWSNRARRRSHDERCGGVAESWLCRCHHRRAAVTGQAHWRRHPRQGSHPRRSWHGFGAADGGSIQIGRRALRANRIQRRYQTDPKRGSRRRPANPGEGIAAQDRRSDPGAAANPQGVPRRDGGASPESRTRIRQVGCDGSGSGGWFL